MTIEVESKIDKLGQMIVLNTTGLMNISLSNNFTLIDSRNLVCSSVFSYITVHYKDDYIPS
jgi:hypothetical protein